MARAVVLGLVLVVVLATSVAAQTPVWVAGSIITNPTANQVLVNSAAVPRAKWKVGITVASPNGGIELLIQHLNSVSVVQKTMVVERYSTNLIYQLPQAILLNAGDSLRVLSRNTVVGEVQASIFLEAVP